MPEAQHTTSLLATLRARSEAAREASAAATLPVAQRTRELGRELASLYRWLDEAFAHLDAIGAPVAHRFPLEPGVELAPLAWDRGFVSLGRGRAAGQDVVTHVEAGYRLAGEGPVSIVVSSAFARPMAERLRAAQLDFDYRAGSGGGTAGPRGVFTVARSVAAAVRFVPDYRRGVVAVALANVDRFESVTLEFPPGGLSERALEDLLRLVLGESDAFLRRAPLAGFARRPGG